MVNRYAGKCCYCSGHVPANGGVCFKKRRSRRWSVAHTACSESKSPRVITAYFPSTGRSAWVNSAGRCEDAPCCGCCS